jgi:hypothetical protein
LRRDECAWDQERDEAEDPVRERRRPGGLDHRGLDDEEDDRQEDDRHVERVQDPREHPGSDPLGDHHLLFRFGSHNTTSQNEQPCARKYPGAAGVV